MDSKKFQVNVKPIISQNKHLSHSAQDKTTFKILTLDAKIVSTTSGETTCKSDDRYDFKYSGSLKKFRTVIFISEKQNKHAKGKS